MLILALLQYNFHNSYRYLPTLRYIVFVCRVQWKKHRLLDPFKHLSCLVEGVNYHFFLPAPRIQSRLPAWVESASTTEPPYPLVNTDLVGIITTRLPDVQLKANPLKANGCAESLWHSNPYKSNQIIRRCQRSQWHLAAVFSFHKIIPKNAQMTTLHINWSLYINFTMIYYIKQE